MRISNISIALDCAHGKDVAGKQSPDGLFKEWQFSREIWKQVKPLLELEGFEVYMINEQDTEMGLSNRKSYLNSLQPSKPLVCISLHNNAAGADGAWHTASGVEVFTTCGNTKSDAIATLFLEMAQERFPKLKFRMDYTDGDPDKEANFTVLRSKWPSILVEWLFQDCKKDVELLMSDAHKQSLVLFIVDFVKALDTKYVSLS